MKKNMGMVDRSIRFLMAAVIGVLYFTGYITGTVAIVLLVLAVVFIVTSFISFCPLYMPFGFYTNKNKQ